MVSATGVGIKEYASVFGRERRKPLPGLLCACPDCGARLHGHGGYERYVGGVLRWLRRVICVACRVTHAVLPEDLCAYRDATLQAVEAAVAPGSVAPVVAARAAGEPAAESARRVRRWLAAFDAAFQQRLLGLLPGIPGTWVERVWQVVGSAPEALVRLRRWLWERYRVFFGGPTGLWRHGRPRDRVRGHSTDLGSRAGPAGGSSPAVRERGQSPPDETGGSHGRQAD